MNSSRPQRNAAIPGGNSQILQIPCPWTIEPTQNRYPRFDPGRNGGIDFEWARLSKGRGFEESANFRPESLHFSGGDSNSLGIPLRVPESMISLWKPSQYYRARAPGNIARVPIDCFDCLLRGAPPAKARQEFLQLQRASLFCLPWGGSLMG